MKKYKKKTVTIYCQKAEKELDSGIEQRYKKQWKIKAEIIKELTGTTKKIPSKVVQFPITKHEIESIYNWLEKLISNVKTKLDSNSFEYNNLDPDLRWGFTTNQLNITCKILSERSFRYDITHRPTML